MFEKSISEITPNIFTSDVYKSGEIWVVQFYRNNCSLHCRDFDITFENMMKSMYDTVHFAKINGSQYGKFVQELDIGFDTTSDGEMPSVIGYFEAPAFNPYKKNKFRDYEIFKRGNDVKEFRRFINKNIVRYTNITVAEIPIYVKNVPLMEMEMFTGIEQEHPDNVFVMVVSKKKKASRQFGSIVSMFYDRGLDFYHMVTIDNSTMICENVSVNATGLFVYDGQRGCNVYDGDMKNMHSMIMFIEKFAPPNKKRYADGRQKTMQLSNIEFQQKVVGGTNGWIIALQGNKSNNEFSINTTSELWDTLLRELQEKTGEMITMATLDCHLYGDVCNLYGGPQLIAFSYASSNVDGTRAPHTGLTSLDEASKIVKESLNCPIHVITAYGGVSHLLTKTKESGVLPVLFLTRKSEPPLLLKALACAQLSHAVIAMYTNPDEGTLEQVKVKKLPAAITFFEKKSDTPPKNGESNYVILRYQTKQLGKMNWSNLGNFIRTLYAEVYPEQKAQKNQDLQQVKMVKSIEIQSLNDFNQYCIKKGGLCVLGFFNTQSVQSNAIATLDRVAVKTAENGQSSLYQFMWVNSDCQINFASYFDVEVMNTPTIAVYSPKKERFATKIGIFDMGSSLEHLDMVLSGRIRTVPLSTRKDNFKEFISAAECKNVASSSNMVVEDEPLEEDDLDDIMEELLEEENLKTKRRAQEMKAKKSKRKKKGQKKRKAKDEL